MATITITINDAKVPKLLDGFARKYPIPLVGTHPAPQFTKAQWARQHLKKYLNHIFWDQENYEARLAVSVARDDTNVSVT